VKHSTRTVLFIISLVSIAAGLVTAAEPIPFSLKRGIPEIEVIINDSIKASFVIDTGADHIYIDKTFAEKHGLLSGRTRAMRPTRGSIGSTEAKLFSVESLKFGDISLSDLSIVAIDLVSQIKDTSKGYPDGALGYSFLKRYFISLNYVDFTIAFGNFPSFPWSRGGALRVVRIPFELKRYLIVMPTTFNDSIKAKTILDTGSSYTVLSPEFADRIRIKNRSRVEKIEIINGLSISDVEILVRDISSITSSIQSDEVVGILGTSFLLGRRYDIDYKNKEFSIYLHSKSEGIEILLEGLKSKD